jgi:PAS domain-containing protein
MGDCHSSGKERDAGTHAEQALRASELNYRRLFEAAQDGILILDADTGRINDVNPFLVKLRATNMPMPLLSLPPPE